MSDTDIDTLRERLKTASDNLNKVLTQYEVHLQKLSLGVPAWITTPEGVHLGYTRFQGQWQLCVADRSVGDEFREVKPLRESSRSVRVIAVQHLILLQEELIRTAHTLTERIEHVLEEMKNLPSVWNDLSKET